MSSIRITKAQKALLDDLAWSRRDVDVTFETLVATEGREGLIAFAHAERIAAEEDRDSDPDWHEGHFDAKTRFADTLLDLAADDAVIAYCERGDDDEVVIV